MRYQTNWAKNYRYTAPEQRFPRTREQVQTLVKAADKVKAIGTRHSFNDIADSEGSQISLQNFQEVTIDHERRRVTVGAGVTYGRLCPILDSAGLALPNLASLPHICVAGACATAALPRTRRR
jgi:xylitol oxidase